MKMARTRVHPTAIVDKKASLGAGVEIGPYSVIGPGVKIGSGTRIDSHATLEGLTEIGRNCVIFPGACLGFDPQDKKFKNEASYLIVGDENIIREHVTMHRGSMSGSKTVVGSRNYFMVNSHVGHDSAVGNDVTLANGAVLGGHAVVQDGAVLGGYSAVHQHNRVGRLAMLGAVGKATSDVPPFSVCDGVRMKVCGVNTVGLKRAGFSSARVLAIRKIIQTLYMSDLSASTAVEKIKAEFGRNDDLKEILDFAAGSKRGMARASRTD